jgi:hypothetical protein
MELERFKLRGGDEDILNRLEFNLEKDGKEAEEKVANIKDIFGGIDHWKEEVFVSPSAPNRDTHRLPHRHLPSRMRILEYLPAFSYPTNSFFFLVIKSPLSSSP